MQVTSTYKNLPLKGNICRKTAVDVKKKEEKKKRTFRHNSSRAIVPTSPQV